MSTDGRRWEPATFLADLSHSVRDDFILKKRVLSFEEYIALVTANPRLHTRNSAQYAVDCFRHFGLVDGDRFRLFDVPFDDGVDRLVGQEQSQKDVFRCLEKFGRQGKVDHLILLHGPNGSAKSTMIQCMARALEFYSSADEGALYRFNWVFPSLRLEKQALGFGRTSDATTDGGPRRSYAYLDEDQVDSKIQTAMKDHPLYLVPKRQRRDLLRDLLADQEDYHLSETIGEGDLSPMNRLIFDNLLVAYNGDLERVWQHVQVERFFLSRRFRRGMVTVEPQLQVDANLRQLTLDRSLESLPKVLQNVTLFEPYGDLVDANRGMIEYNDLLKKPIEAFKYLLATCEKSTVTLPSAILHLDTVFIASSNDRYLRAFLEHPDWPSFKGRIELVRVPYLLDWVAESRIYESQVRPDAVGRHVAPHTMRVAGLFGVLTRLVKPRGTGVPATAAEAVGRLSPLEKADLYALGKSPEWAPLAVAIELASAREALRNDGVSRSPYEGEVGASPREIKTILFNAALSDRYRCLSPLSVFDGLEELLKDRTLYEFLRVQPDGDYMDHPRLVATVRQRYLEWADDDVRRSMGLATEEQHVDLMARYAQTVNVVLRGEKVRNPITGKLEEPDPHFLEDVEQMLGVGHDPGAFRRQVLGTIGAWSLDHSGTPVPYATLFGNILQQIRTAYFQRHQPMIRRLGQSALQVLGGETPSLTATERARVDAVITDLETRGYCRHCAGEVLGFVLHEKYG
jgi:predicted Ser/Thr protein kinase